MSTASVNLLKERVIRAALAAADELEDGAPRIHTKATRELLRAVKAYKAETWRIDEAPSLIKALVHIIELQPESTSILGAKISRGEQETVLRAKAFLGEREVNDDTTPVVRPKHKGPKSRLG
jgi:hypothetical protein